jgi:hypothetical protein
MLEVIVDPYLMDHITARFEDAVKIGQEILDVSDEDMLQAMEAEDQIEGAVRELSRAAVGFDDIAEPEGLVQCLEARRRDDGIQSADVSLEPGRYPGLELSEQRLERRQLSVVPDVVM